MQDEYEHINFWKNGESDYPEQLINLIIGKPCESSKSLFGGIKHFTVSALNTPSHEIDSVFLLGDAVTEPGESITVGNIWYKKL